MEVRGETRRGHCGRQRTEIGGGIGTSKGRRIKGS